LNLIGGGNTMLFAPPAGSFNDQTVEACLKLNLEMILWNRDTIDWRDKDVSTIINRATNALAAGDFVLMHPTDCTVKALPTILQYIKENGFLTQTVSENLGEECYTTKN
jgi:peptidoglycan/xylan/chitin deacetylase (PgdA/CDA1 family)